MTAQHDSQRSKVTVRPALESDASWCINQLKDFADFYGSEKSLFGDEAYALKAFTEKINKHLVYVAEKGDELVGFISGYITPHIYNPHITVLTESFWWVMPEHRGSRAGYLLFRAFVDFGRENCDWVITTLESHSPVKDEFLLKQGFKEKERSFIYEVN